MPEAKPVVTDTEKLILNALERSVEANADHAIVVLLSETQMDVLATSKLCHHQLSALFLALSQRHRDYAAEVEAENAKNNVEIVH